MKKIIILFLLLFVFNFTNAQSITITGCLELNSNIRKGMKDSASSSNVYALQSFLKVNNYMTANPTGYFGALTLKGVKAFQKANNISTTGLVGPLTRAEIKRISCEISTPLPMPPVEPEIPVPAIPVVEAPVVPILLTVPVAPIVEDVILPAPNNSSLRVRTDGTVSIASESLLVRGTVTAGARSGTESWFELTTNPTIYKVSESTVSTKTSKRTNTRFEHLFSGLKANTTYYYRACAGNTSLGQKSCGATVSSTTTNI